MCIRTKCYDRSVRNVFKYLRLTNVGVNIVLRNMTWQEKDAIIYFDTIYKACENTLISIQEMNPQLHLRKVGHNQDFGYSLPCTHSEILNAFSQTISRLMYDGYKPKLAIFDAIVSLPGVRFPFERLAKLCKEYGILSLIDGAHGIGQIPLNMNQVDPDFFVSNCHKWLYTPRGCAVFFVPKRNQHLIRTSLPTSHGFIPSSKGVAEYSQNTKSDFIKLFQYTATIDNSPYYCVPAACNFREKLCGGEEAIYNHIRNIAQRGADILASVLGTEVMDDLDPGEGLKAMGSYEGGDRRAGNWDGWSGGLRDCAMANVLLPIKIAGNRRQGSLALGPGGAGSGGGLTLGLGGGRKFSAGYSSPQRSPSFPPDQLPWTDAHRSSSPTRTSEDNGPIIVRKTDLSTHITWMLKTLVNEFQTNVQIFEYNNKVWTRISGQIYLELKDFEWLGGVLKGLCERVRMGESLRTDAMSAWKQRTQSTIDLEALGQGIANFNVS